MKTIATVLFLLFATLAKSQCDTARKDFDFSWKCTYGYCGLVTFSFSNSALLYSFNGINYTGLSSMSTFAKGKSITVYAKDSCGHVRRKQQYF